MIKLYPILLELRGITTFCNPKKYVTGRKGLKGHEL